MSEQPMLQRVKQTKKILERRNVALKHLTVHGPWKVSLILRQKLKEELDRLIDLGIKEQVELRRNVYSLLATGK